MFVHQARLHFASALLRLAAFLQTDTLRLGALARPARIRIVDRWLAKATRHDFRTMSGLELHDVGRKRADVPIVGWDAWIDTRSRP
jgi:hypothetical protein